jgi:hypothetical protein
MRSSTSSIIWKRKDQSNGTRRVATPETVDAEVNERD